MGAPNISIAIILQATGVLDAPAKTAANPTLASNWKEIGIRIERALPSVVPIKTSGTNSPPLKPEPTVNAVKNILRRGSLSESGVLSASLIKGIPSPT